ncbi:hypothetical protein [Laspinema olomoucense]|uniref:Uncharacterized protein n=1 Tax=Laspinema olomoucense D3b TaxID=2953688 RepID=A0ABT2N258_9CYAN|nr:MULTISPECIES: hypothetical protein [unclassified Laspinema]MCT7976667.1 hypothetical protein [Laspinema sp. D3b]
MRDSSDQQFRGILVNFGNNKIRAIASKEAIALGLVSVKKDANHRRQSPEPLSPCTRKIS